MIENCWYPAMLATIIIAGVMQRKRQPSSVSDETLSATTIIVDIMQF